MTKRILFSLFTGILFGLLLTVTPEAKAQEGPCYGYCQLRHVLLREYVRHLPQYLLLAKGGKVLHRWDGVRRYEQPPPPEELAKFFQ